MFVFSLHYDKYLQTLSYETCDFLNYCLYYTVTITNGFKDT